MSLVHRCDNCKKLILNDNKMTKINYEYDLGLDDDEPKRRQIFLNDQRIYLQVSLRNTCGEEQEICDNCASLIIKKLLKNSAYN